MKIVLSATPSSVFSHISDLKSKYHSILTLTELGPLVSESSTRTSKVLWPHWFWTQFHKTRRIGNWLSIGFDLGLPWLRTYFYNHCTMFNTIYSMMGSLKVFIYPKYWDNPGDLSLPLNCASALKIHTQRPE